MPCSCNKPAVSYETKNTIHLCCVCDSKLFGRSDKVFCNVNCKNKYHAELRRHNKTVSKETIKILNKNYQTLCFLLGKNCSKFKINKLELERKGFNYEIVSGFSQTKFGFKLKIYEFSLYITHHNQVIISRDSEQSEISPFVYERWERFYKNNEHINSPI
ncbi:MAG: hypothetical protein V4622_01295 [Bacteroidota bacterium]